ncbi:hypothetical protein J4730_00600 [Klebsiella pneumoniae]|uniref:Uncharacterized protein n=1 Tax=Klebsiella pneumoniae TaxID=573 RepID=A0A939NNP6_KLEPN|nr:hypothetical protein [Klebsiella pneumoniae]
MAAAPDPAYMRMGLRARQFVGPRKRQRRRAMTTGRETRAGWRLRLTRPTCGMGLLARQSRRPAQASAPPGNGYE